MVLADARRCGEDPSVRLRPLEVAGFGSGRGPNRLPADGATPAPKQRRPEPSGPGPSSHPLPRSAQRRRRPATSPAIAISPAAPGAGTATRNPRISPPGNADVWMLWYARPSSNASSIRFIACEIVPPLADTNAGLYVDALVRSKVMSYVPAVTPAGNPANVGVVVITPAVPWNGFAVGPWMCDAVVFPISPLNSHCTRIAARSRSTVTNDHPIPDELFGGASAGPVSCAQ